MVQKRNLLNQLSSVLDDKIIELISRRRRQIMVHSAIYYKLSTSLITDNQFDKWAYELVDLQKRYTKESCKADLYQEFKEWDGTTGFNLNFNSFIGLAEYLVKICEEK